MSGEAVRGQRYDSVKVYGFLKDREIEPVVKPWRNSRLDTGYRLRRRWAVETVYSSFKRLFREHCLARNLKNIARELAGKVTLYNILVNM